MDTKKIELIGDNHEFFSLKTPLRKDAFDKSDNEKIKNIQKHFRKIVDEFFKSKNGHFTNYPTGQGIFIKK